MFPSPQSPVCPTDDPLDLGEGVGDEVGTPSADLFFSVAVLRKEDRGAAGVVAGMDIGGDVADHPRFAEVEIEITGSAAQHPRRGFAAVALDGVAVHTASGWCGQ